MIDVGAILRRLLGAKGGLNKVRFRQRGRLIECYVPGDSVWTVVKDNLILCEYERMGIDLDAVRGTVIDAGAHAGLFTLRAAASATRVVALEPHPRLQELFQRNMLHNFVHNVDALSNALWVREKEVGLFQGDHSGSTSVFGSGQPTFRAQSVTLAELVEDAREVELLKLDIEGAEFAVLLDCSPETLTHISTIVAEIHLDGRAPLLPSLVRHLESCGFRVTIREQPLHYWRESIARALKSWRSVESLTALKLAVICIYSLVAIGRLLSLPVEPDIDKLKFLYAVREKPRRG